MINITQIHHVAYRCRDAKETAEFYKNILNMDLLVSIAEEKVPSTKEPNPYIHIFLDAGMGNILAFFEITGEKEMSRDLNTPKWVQHIAFQLENEKSLVEAKKELEEKGIDVLGTTDHGIIKSIYFFDPNGHRLELTCVTGTSEQMKSLKEIAPKMLEEWSQTKRPPKDTAWLHEKEFKSKKDL
jgi:catechol 2,3-dioxygenase-like lactoylglutathione lyase family enzyme